MAQEESTAALTCWPSNRPVQSATFFAAGAEGSLEKGVFTLSGQPVMCTDSTVKHAFDFTPSMSLFVDCRAARELDRLFEALSAGGSVFMPPDSYRLLREIRLGPG